MTAKTNYHMHTTFCDGKNTPEEMVQEALARGFTTIGFSSHSMYPFSSDWHISCRDHLSYANEIKRLQEAYKDKIEIMLGYEADFVEGVCCPIPSQYPDELKPEYLIGAVHYVPWSKGYFGVDTFFDKAREQIKRVFNGDVKKAVQEYFACEREMLKAGDFQILAHCDLVKIQNSPKAPYPLFNEEESWYRDCIKETADAIAKSGVCVEINTGAMARGKLDSPYPSPELLEMLHEKNVPVTLSSDAHSTEHLDFAFDKAILLAKKAGYTEFMYFSGGKALMQKFDA
ncbi:MAG: histidinol-phosphatase [Treponema sp.]|nr:histidinol-phosphatase [Treponema sp.]MBR7078916.1 histidinol-phosphatase [Treponema sp.]